MHQTCKVPTFQPIRVVRYPARRPIPRAQSSLGDSDRSTSALGAVDLPYGVLWWSDRTHNVYQHDVLHGQDFVLQRSRPGGPGLVLARQISSVQIVDQEERQRVSIQAFQAKSDTNLHLATTDAFTFDITDYALVDEPSTKQLADGLAAQLYPPTSCTGVVLVSQERHEQTDQVKFTCKRCGTSSLKAVNPHAWATGTVFARCDGCQVIHKLTDNLELFHELAGPVIEPRPDMTQVKIPDSLPQRPYMP